MYLEATSAVSSLRMLASRPGVATICVKSCYNVGYFEEVECLLGEVHSPDHCGNA